MPVADPTAGPPRRLGRQLASAALATPLLAACAPDAPPVVRPPDVLFISVDTLAAEHLSLYGYGRATTPRLEAFAADAVVFEDAIANAPWTLPSYVSQFTGLYPDGLRRRPFEREDTEAVVSYAVPPSRPTLAELFAGAGYRTAAWVDNPWLSPAVGLDRGFDRFDDDDTRLPGPPTDSGLRTIAPEVLEWIADDDPRPFFAFVHCVDTHGPYFTGAPGLAGEPERTPPGEVPVSDYGGVFGAVPAHVLPPDERPPAGSPVDPGAIADRYDAGIRRLDGILGDFLDELERRGRLDRAIVVVSSDHGESVGQHGWYFDHALLYEDTLRIPLVLRLPRDERAGRRVAQGVELVDLLPTLVELCGLGPAPEGLDGRSLVGHLRDDVPAPAERPRFASAMLFDATSVRSGPLKLISADRSLGGPQTLASTAPGLEFLSARAPELFPDGPELAPLLARPRSADAVRALVPDLQALFPEREAELYDLAADPAERADRAAPTDPRTERLRDLVRARRAEDARRRERYLPEFEANPSGELDAAARDRLRDLGYLQDSDG